MFPPIYISSFQLTCILYQVGAISADHPLLLSFSMWWLVHNFFGIGCIRNQVKLRWRHIRLIRASPDSEEECLEYCGPKDLLTKNAYHCKHVFKDTPTQLGGGKPGPDFVALFKAFMQHRPSICCEANSRFYLQVTALCGSVSSDLFYC